jgi:hypothetical protein
MGPLDLQQPMSIFAGSALDPALGSQANRVSIPYAQGQMNWSPQPSWQGNTGQYFPYWPTSP